MVIIKTAAQIKGIRRSCRLAAQSLKYLSTLIRPGLSTEELDQKGAAFIKNHGALSAPLGYGGYPKSICTSLNNVVCHGIPASSEKLKEGDIINIDVTTILDGYYGDTSATFPVGKISATGLKLINVSRQACLRAIAACRPGRYLNDCVGKTIQPLADRHRFSVVHELGGHGVGLKFHEDPFVFHFDTGRRDLLLKPGMIFTIEPMINASPDYRIQIDPRDGWTVRTLDGSLSAQFEHTILITPTGAKILTQA